MMVISEIDEFGRCLTFGTPRFVGLIINLDIYSQQELTADPQIRQMVPMS
jgi:hypothetical protein